jgi:hypothetical protein
MPPNPHPIAPHDNGQFVVKPQLDHSRSPARGYAKNFLAAVAPGKMVTPNLLTRIEQPDGFVRKRINAFRLRPFVLIAQFAGQAQVLLCVSTPSGKRPDVVNLKPAHNVILVTQAVLTAIPRALTDAPSHAD